MVGYVVILAALQLGVPVNCYQSQPIWNQQVRARDLAPSVAFYDPNDGRSINLSPLACKQVLAPTLEGANTLAHELAHLRQDVESRPFNEREADRVAHRSERFWLRRLSAVLHRRPQSVPSADRPVVLGP